MMTGIALIPVAPASTLMVRALLLVDAEDHRLQRRVSRLDDVSGSRLRVGWQAVRDGHDQGRPTGAQLALQRSDIEQDPVAGLGLADQVGVGQGLDRLAGGTAKRHVVLGGSGPLCLEPFDGCLAPLDHVTNSSAGDTSRAGPWSGSVDVHEHTAQPGRQD